MAPFTDYRTYFLKQYVASVRKMGLKSQLEEYLEAEHMRNISVQPSLQPSGLKGHRLQATSGNLHFSILDVVGYPGRLIMQGSGGGRSTPGKSQKQKKRPWVLCIAIQDIRTRSHCVASHHHSIYTNQHYFLFFLFCFLPMETMRPMWLSADPGRHTDFRDWIAAEDH